MSDQEVVYGRNPVRELLKAGRRGVRRVRALDRLTREPWLKGAPVSPADKATLGRIAGTGDHQGVVALVDPYPYATLREVLALPGPIVALDGAQDPRNLGAICRVADAAGAHALVITSRGSPGVTSVVCKASAGAVEHLAVARCESMTGFLLEARQDGRTVVGTDPESSTDYRGQIPADAVIVLGSEGGGLRPRVAEACDRLVAIPMRGRVESLNISVAAGLVLFEAGRQA